MMFCICAIIATWFGRSGRFGPLRVALTWSPLKYAVRCSNSLKSSIERNERFEPWICWLNMPRRLVVSSRKRASLRAHVGRQVKGRVGVEVLMTVQAGHAETLIGGLAILRLVELLLRKWREQQPQPFHLHRRDDADHQ